jgi:hypothetical protein
MAEVRYFEGRRVIGVSLVVAALGIAGMIVGVVVAPGRALHAYLAAFATVASIAVGALILQLIGYAANTRWLSVPRRIVGTIALAVVPLAALFVPIALGVAWLYVWADPHAVAALPEEVRALLEHKRPYLNVPFFVVRTAVYFAIWITAAGLLRVWSRRHDGRPADPEAALGRERAFASAMLPPVGLAMSFAAFDWLMSLEPTWTSTIFGVYYFAGGFLAGVATVAICAWAGVRSGQADGALSPHHFHALARLLLAFTVFWAYVAYFQVFLIQIADRPNEVSFYLHRLSGSWRAFVIILAIGHFALPFLLLLPRAPKFRAGRVAAVAAWILVVHYLDLYWLVLPTATPAGAAPHPLDLAALAAVVGPCVAFCAWLQRGETLVPAHDPFLPEGLGYASPT